MSDRVKYKVLKPFRLVYGSTAGGKTPTTGRTLEVGEIIEYECTAPNCYSWFYDSKGQRGYNDDYWPVASDRTYIERGRLELITP